MSVEASPGTVCEKCGVRFFVGQWYQCPHDTFGGMAFKDDIPGGLTVENYGPHPMTFYSHSERRRYMAAHDLRETEKFCPMPGTDKDPQGIPNPKGFMDPVTLENARILLGRAAEAVETRKREEEATNRVLGNFSVGVVEEEDAKTYAQFMDTSR